MTEKSVAKGRKGFVPGDVLVCLDNPVEKFELSHIEGGGRQRFCVGTIGKGEANRTVRVPYARCQHAE